ncbi:hypothetical protein BDD12DRAFT_803429 [Trichophaea hybrida]|nr:hypothetical protein BDD12DRAFT_803429 [Trichophaea hybrida]
MTNTLLQRKAWMPAPMNVNLGASQGYQNKSRAFGYDEQLDIAWEKAHSAFQSYRQAGTTACFDACRTTTLAFLNRAALLKEKDHQSMMWYGFWIPYLQKLYPRWLVGCIIFASLSISLLFATQESVPGGVAKPGSVKGFTAFAAACKLGAHISLYFLAENPEKFDQHSLKIIFGSGLLSAALKVVECLLICHIVDEKMLVDSAGKFGIVAAGLSEGLLVVATSMVHRSGDVVVFGRKGVNLFNLA